MYLKIQNQCTKCMQILESLLRNYNKGPNCQCPFGPEAIEENLSHGLRAPGQRFKVGSHTESECHIDGCKESASITLLRSRPRTRSKHPRNENG